ncbi:hypothetical protein Tco_0639582 [Tanacetum coccineum]
MGAVVAGCFKVKRAVVVESDNGGDCVRGHDWWCDGYGLSGEAVIIGAEQSIVTMTFTLIELVLSLLEMTLEDDASDYQPI